MFIRRGGEGGNEDDEEQEEKKEAMDKPKEEYENEEGWGEG